jgi:hypothetical protein
MTMHEKSVLLITQTDEAYVLDLQQVGRVYCGFGAEWPKSITISRSDKQCVAK